MKRQAAVALLLSVLLLTLFVVAVGWEDVLAAIQRATLEIYVFVFVATSVCLVFRSLVWHRLLSVVDRPRPHWLVGGIFLTAMFAKYVTPYGQVTSGVGVAAIVSRYYDSAYEEALAAVVSADFLNYIPYYTFGSIGVGYVLLVHSPAIDILAYVPTATAVSIAVVLLLGIVWLRQTLILEGLFRVVDGVRGLLGRIAPGKAHHLRRENVIRRFEGFQTTLSIVTRDRHTVGIALVYAHVGWLAFAAALYLSAAAVHHPVPFGVAVLCVALSKVGFILPTPGGLGGVELALSGVLYLLTPMTGAIALAVAILYRFGTYWFTVLVGGVTSIALSLKDPLPPEAE